MAIVNFQISDHELRKEQRPITFWAKNRKGPIGCLVVSKGGLRWYPGKRTKRHYLLTWGGLAKKIPEISRIRS